MIKRTLEIKSTSFSSAGGFEWEGYASAYGVIDSYGDIVEKGAFSGQIGKTIPAFYEHKTEIGKIKVVGEDSIGLIIKGQLPNDDIQNPKVGRISERLRWLMSDTEAGAIAMKMSVGFYMREHTFGKLDGVNVRRIQKGELVEVSLVSNPANPDAVITDFKNVGVLTLDDFDSLDVRALELELRNGRPLSRELAKKLASLCKNQKQNEQKPDLEAIKALFNM